MKKKKELFGEMAIRLGFITPRDLESALRRQKELAARSGKHRLLGLVLVEMGLLGNDQFIALLREAELDTTLHAQPQKPVSFGD